MVKEKKDTKELLNELEQEMVRVEKEKVDLRNDKERIAYLEHLCENIKEAKKQCEDIKFEYGQVTSYLKDIQLIDRAPKEEQEKLLAAAKQIVELTKERKKSQKQEYKFTEAQRRAMDNYEDVVEDDIKKLTEYEEYQMKIKQDLRQLSGEKNLLFADKQDIIHRQGMLKVLGKCLTALLIATFAMLAVLMACFKVNINVAFVVTVFVTFVFAAIILNEARKNRIDMVITEKKGNRAIFLLNRVKIKYVNNVRTLDYMYHKYQVRNAAELSFVRTQYIRAKREWERQRESSIRIHEANQVVLQELRKLEVKDCDIWLGQVEALVEPKEMVEVRHDLNVRRQKLREQMDYNTSIMEQCLDEIDKIRSKKPDIDYTLYLCTDRNIMTTETIEESVELAIKGGVSVVQLREKECSSREFYEMAKAVKTITDAYEVPLLINDRIDIALAVGADGVHLGQSDLPLDAARNLLGADKIVGATANTVELAQKAWREGADYLGVGDVFGTTTKADTRHITLEELKEIKESVPIPIVAIGGVNEDNIALLRETGVDGAAVISAIVGQKDITAAAEELISNFRGA